MSMSLSKEELAAINGRFLDTLSEQEQSIFARAEAAGKVVRQDVNFRVFVFVPEP